jgi:hypothetical protein
LLRLSERSSTEATTTASSATASNASLSPTSDNDDAETPRPKDGPRDPFAGRQLEESVRETMTPTRTRPHPSPYGNSSQGPLSAQ